MDVCPDDSFEHDFRIRFDDQVKYITVEPGTYEYETLYFPPAFLEHLPDLPNDGWVSARISRTGDSKSSKLCVKLSYDPLEGIHLKKLWHPTRIDVLSLKRMGSLSARCQLVQYGTSVAVAKIARFGFELPFIEAETSMYEMIEGHSVGPKFYGHLVENGRVIGILIEYLQGRHAGSSDIHACEDALRRLHALDICHGDLNRYNFVVSDDDTKLIDFEHGRKAESGEMERELSELRNKLADESGLGGKNLPAPDEQQM